jgi:spermidine/putrescine transport system substrate-binding protein
MRRRAFLLSAMASGCAARKPRLNVFNWSAYVAPETVPDFEKEFGVSVRYAIYESNEEMLARVFSGNSGWDVVFPTHYFIPPMREQGLLARLDGGRLSNLKNLDPLFREPASDPRLEWSVPYMWNATGILYHKKLSPPPGSWSDMWSPRLRGRVTMLDDPAEVFGAALRKLGLSINSAQPAELERAKAAAIEQKPLLRAYLNAEVRDQIVAGDVLAAQMWSTTGQQAIDASKDIGFAYPLDGYALNLDCAVILRESPRKELAHEFLNYLLRPKVAARIAEAARTASANGAAREFMNEATRNNPVLYPPPEVLQRGEWFAPMTPEAQRLRDRMWTEIKSA